MIAKERTFLYRDVCDCSRKKVPELEAPQTLYGLSKADLWENPTPNTLMWWTNLIGGTWNGCWFFCCLIDEVMGGHLHILIILGMGPKKKARTPKNTKTPYILTSLVIVVQIIFMYIIDACQTGRGQCQVLWCPCFGNPQWHTWGMMVLHCPLCYLYSLIRTRIFKI